MKNAPKSYLNSKRPPIEEALKLEDGSLDDRITSLEKKGYFTPPPRPWKLGFKNRGLGHGDCAVLDKFGDLVVETANQETAELIINSVNNEATKNLPKQEYDQKQAQAFNALWGNWDQMPAEERVARILAYKDAPKGLIIATAIWVSAYYKEYEEIAAAIIKEIGA